MPRLLPNETLRLLVKVSKLYYEDGLNQDEILARLNLSRSKVSRLLHQARQEGIVQISIVSPPRLFANLESRLESRFGLYEALVVESHPGDSQETVSRIIGAAAADYLARALREKMTIGVSWGSTLKNMTEALAPQQLPDVQVVQIIGGLGLPEAEVHATELCRRMARALNCRLTLLPAPGIVASRAACQALLADSYIQRAVEMFSRLDLALVGVGAPTPHSVVLRDSAIINPAELADLLQRGAVGDIALRFFDRQGRPVRGEMDERIIGIRLEQLQRVPRVVGVSGGPEKFAALHGALHGKLINVLITDSLSAQKLLDSDRQEGDPR